MQSCKIFIKIFEISLNFLHFYSNFNYFVRYSRDLNQNVRYIHEISLIKDAKPNQEVDFVRYNREFVITVIVITEFDCM
jgi:hypothetical protein